MTSTFMNSASDQVSQHQQADKSGPPPATRTEAVYALFVLAAGVLLLVSIV
jgi:hypothetical protein